MTLEQLKQATGAKPGAAEKFLPFLKLACTNYEIASPVAQLCFIAQVGHESGGLYYTAELANGAAYEGRKDLGNTQAGDGLKFKGRGLIQITGRANYALLSRDFNVDFISDPSLLGGKNEAVCTDDQIKYAALSAGWYWHRHNLNAITEQIDINKPIDENDELTYFKQITHVINGGYNGLADRLSRYKAGLPFFK